MIERLQRVLERIEQLPAEIQNEVAEQLEDWVMPFNNQKEAVTQRRDVPTTYSYGQTTSALGCLMRKSPPSSR
jgi:hypothetical protein